MSNEHDYFFPLLKPLWKIERGRQAGPHLNSPLTWREAGYIRAADEDAAYRRACFICGTSQVRVEQVPPVWMDSTR